MTQPETDLRNAIKSFLRKRRWLVEVFPVGSIYQKGIPDLFLWHREHGFRWVDIKVPERNSLTPAQRRKWPVWENARLGVWILTAASEAEYQKLFQPPNWREFWKPVYDRREQELIDLWSELEREQQRPEGYARPERPGRYRISSPRAIERLP